MHLDARPLFGLALLLALLPRPGHAAIPAVAFAAPAACTATGHLISGPTLNRDPRWADSALSAVAAAGPGDVWAVGAHTSDANSGSAPGGSLIEHWTGSAWEQVPSPSSASARYVLARLNGLAVISPRDIWAVGAYAATGQTSPGVEPLVQRWDGTRWTILPGPAGVHDLELTRVAAAGPADVWIAGSSTRAVGRVFHWDGQTWHETPVPELQGTDLQWVGLAAPAPGEAWILGSLRATGGGQAPLSLLARWDGHTWVTQSVALLPAQTQLSALAANGPQDVWVAGTVVRPYEPPPSALPGPTATVGVTEPRLPTVFVHWDGQHWSLVPAPDNYLITSLMFLNGTDGWAGGIKEFGPQWGLLHWDGTRWTPVAVTGADRPFEATPQVVSGLASEGPDDVWAVGIGNLAGRPPHDRFSIIHIFRDCAVPTAPAPDPQDPAVSYFPATGHTLRGLFRAYWQTHGGLAQFGYPLTDEFSERNATDGRVYTVQYFERNRFELHPEYAGTPYHVLLGLLGHTMTTPLRPEQAAAFQPLGQAPPGALFFPVSGHSLAPAFRAYWEAHGGLAVYGYPISEAFEEISPTDSKPYLVQYFERNRLELHPELPAPFRVSLGLLGVDLLRSRGWLP